MNARSGGGEPQLERGRSFHYQKTSQPIQQNARSRARPRSGEVGARDRIAQTILCANGPPAPLELGGGRTKTISVVGGQRKAVTPPAPAPVTLPPPMVGLSLSEVSEVRKGLKHVGSPTARRTTQRG